MASRCFAVLPVIVFFIGKMMHSRFMGVFLAGLVIIQELNAIASGNRLNLSHSKLLMTEFPTKIGLAALILLLFLWLRKPENSIAYALPLGGLLGVVILVRYNTLVMPFGVIAGVMLIYGKAWRKGLKASILLIIALGITLSPWVWHGWETPGNPFFFAPEMIERLRGVEARGAPQKTPEISQTRFSQPGELFTKPLRSQDDGKIPGVWLVDFASQTGIAPISPPQTGVLESDAPLQSDGHGRLYLIANHFVHNLITNFLILPTSLPFDFLPASNTDGSLYESVPFWKNLNDGWLEDLAPVNLVGIALNLLLLSLGIGASWRKWQWAGLIPLGVLLAYHLSTALVRDSGGRYIVPVDWIVLLFFWYRPAANCLLGPDLVGIREKSALP